MLRLFRLIEIIYFFTVSIFLFCLVWILGHAALYISYFVIEIRDIFRPKPQPDKETRMLRFAPEWRPFCEQARQQVGEEKWWAMMEHLEKINPKPIHELTQVDVYSSLYTTPCFTGESTGKINKFLLDEVGLFPFKKQ